jgi:hypothetical protein
MRLKIEVVFCLCVTACLGAAPRLLAQEQNWTNYVRIGAYGLNRSDAESIVRDAQKSHVFGIEVDNDIPGRYESFLDPTAKLEAIRAVATAAHKANNHAFVYIAGTECITAHADQAAHSVVKDHPEWLQRNLAGEPAVFTSGAAFWISPGDEDVWISPYAKDWRKVYMERVRQIAATGIDGIYVDIPYWMTHFDGWENSWASFDDATVAAFREKTGLNARKDLKLGDFKDPNFRQWLDFRIATLTDFIKEIRQNARNVNPQIMVIPEIYPGIEQESTRVGADVYEMYGVSDAIAHEYEFGGGDHMASSRTQFDWFLYQAGMLTFRAFAEGKATWILNYSWDGDKNVDAREAMRTLANSQIIDGANFWDAPGHSMAGSNDEATRKQIFQWIEKHEKTFYLPRQAMQPVGVYFSPKSRDYDPETFLPAYRGLLLLLLRQHREFQVVTPRTLSEFHGALLVLPEVNVSSPAEKESLKRFVESGRRIVSTGKTPQIPCDTHGVTCFATSPQSVYLEALQRDFSAGTETLPKEFLTAISLKTDIEVDAPPTIAANLGKVDGVPHLFLANFTGIVPGKIVIPTPVNGIRVKLPATFGDRLVFLPFLGETQSVNGTRKDDIMEFVLPPLGRGAVVWPTSPR